METRIGDEMFQALEILHYRRAEPVESEADDTTETQETEVIS